MAWVRRRVARNSARSSPRTSTWISGQGAAPFAAARRSSAWPSGCSRARLRSALDFEDVTIAMAPGDQDGRRPSDADIHPPQHHDRRGVARRARVHARDATGRRRVADRAGDGRRHARSNALTRRRIEGTMALKVGDEAPDFELRSHRGGTVKLSDFRGKRQVVVAFHPLAFTPVCATQMCGYESDLGRFEAANAAVLGDQRRRAAGQGRVGEVARPDLLRSAERLSPPRRGRPRSMASTARRTASPNEPSSSSTPAAGSPGPRSTTSPSSQTTAKCSPRWARRGHSTGTVKGTVTRDSQVGSRLEH